MKCWPKNAWQIYGENADRFDGTPASLDRQSLSSATKDPVEFKCVHVSVYVLCHRGRLHQDDSVDKLFAGVLFQCHQ